MMARVVSGLVSVPADGFEQPDLQGRLTRGLHADFYEAVEHLIAEVGSLEVLKLVSADGP